MRKQEEDTTASETYLFDSVPGAVYGVSGSNENKKPDVSRGVWWGGQAMYSYPGQSRFMRG